MRNLFCLLLLASTSFSAFAQIKATILDSTTKKPVPYVNIWVDGENNGTSSDEKGNFSLNITSEKTIILSAVGYEKTNLKSVAVGEIIYMNPQAIELGEVIIDKPKNNRTLQIGSLKKPKMTHYVAIREDYPTIRSNYYSYKPEYTNTQYLKTLKLITLSDVESAVFNLRFYAADKNGKPGNFLYDENILCEVKKGKRTNTIDLSSYNIKFPESGLFIALEWLVLERNRYYYIANSITESDGKHYHIKKKDRGKTHMLSPSFGATSTQDGIDHWICTQGSWNKQTPRPGSGTLQFEITLTN